MAIASPSDLAAIESILGDDAESLLSHECTTIPRDRLHLPGPDYVDRVVAASDRPIPVMRSLQTLIDHGRLGGTGYLSILPVDQGIEHSAGASFAKNPDYFDPERHRPARHRGRVQRRGDDPRGARAPLARRYAHRIPFLLKLNHNEFLSYPNAFDQIMFASVRQAREQGCVAVGATIYFGSPESKRQIQEVATAFQAAHELGMATVLWCYLRNAAFTTTSNGTGHDYHVAADLTGQANHLGVTLQADIIKQKAPETAAPGFLDLKFGKTDKRVYSELMTDHPIDMTRYQVANCYMGRAGLINSGGASSGASDLHDAVFTAVVNKRAGGMGMISGRKAFQRPMDEGIALLNAIQDAYLCDEVTIA